MNLRDELRDRPRRATEFHHLGSEWPLVGGEDDRRHIAKEGHDGLGIEGPLRTWRLPWGHRVVQFLEVRHLGRGEVVAEILAQGVGSGVDEVNVSGRSGAGCPAAFIRVDPLGRLSANGGGGRGFAVPLVGESAKFPESFRVPESPRTVGAR